MMCILLTILEILAHHNLISSFAFFFLIALQLVNNVVDRVENVHSEIVITVIVKDLVFMFLDTLADQWFQDLLGHS